MLRRYAIWDIDNCLADDKWRAHLIDWSKTGNARYAAYNEQMLGDPAHHLREFKFVCRFTTPVFFTGRCEMYAEQTRTWLTDHTYGAPLPGLLYMRGNDEQLPPAALKQRMLQQLLSRIYDSTDIVAAFDDVPAVVEMYKMYGIPATVLRINDDFSGIYEPRDLAPISNHA